MKCNMFLKTLILFLFGMYSFVAGKVIPERKILLEFKSSVSDPSGILSSWNPNSTNPCSWFGITCNSKSRVVSLNLTGGRGYKGNSQAPSCSKFPFYGFGLKRPCLYSKNGKLAGQISPLIGFLTELRVLSIACNDLSGEIPREIWGLEKLEVLDLEGNLFTGKLPDEFVGLGKLRVLNLGFNRIDGEIPLSMSKCVGLEVLSLAGNKVEGSIPQFFGGFWKLRGLYLANNRLNGLIPTEFGRNCQYLEHLDLSGNFLVGRIPGELGNCRQLKTLLLFSNMLNDVFPPELGRLQNLEVLDVSRNSLSGLIPAELGNCAELSILVLSNLFDPLTNDGNTRGDGVLAASTDEYNSFQGSIPTKITSLPKLSVVWAPRANLEGNLPSNWGGCESLQMVNLAQNHFDGELVGVFDGCKKLHYLDLSSNMLTGELDGKLPVPCMTVFDVSRNLMSGLIPRFDYSICPHVRFLNFGHIQAYNPSIAYELFFTCKTRQRTLLPFSNSSFVVIHNFGGNYFTGPIPQLPVAPERLGKMTDYAFLAGGNQFTGSFPGVLFGKCNKLHGMIANVSSNKLYGRFPLKISEMCPSLRFLDISKNRISGVIPQSFGDSRSLLVLDFNRKKQQGQVPSSLHIFSRSVSSSDLAGSNESSQSNSTSSSDHKTGNSGMHSIELASIASASAIVSVLLILVVLYFSTRKLVPKSRVQVAESREITVFSDIGVPLTYENIVQATGNFNASKCIGNGGFGATYKAEISPVTLVAVKRLAVGRFQGIQQFHTEIKTLERVRHRNLVTLIGYHASETEMFLIYNYLPGGNLENFIRERSATAFGWKILHKIALDVASALAYLHDQCAPKVLHRDVKPSNILLDDDLNAYLSDFGLSRLLGTSQTHATTGVAGTFGYVAPEYALTCRVSEKADVYSYGVVLLELLSDKKALDPSFSSEENGFNIVSWALMMLRQGQAKDVFTAGLWDAGPHDDLVEILYLAIQCTVDSLSSRPTMKQVVQRLKQIRPS